MSREKVEDISLSTSSPSRVEPSKYEMKETVGLALFATITTKKKRQNGPRPGQEKNVGSRDASSVSIYRPPCCDMYFLILMLLTCRLPYILCVLAYLIGIGTAQFIRDMLTMRKVYRKSEGCKSKKNNKRRRKRIIEEKKKKYTKKADKMLNVLYIDKQKERKKYDKNDWKEFKREGLNKH